MRIFTSLFIGLCLVSRSVADITPAIDIDTRVNIGAAVNFISTNAHYSAFPVHSGAPGDFNPLSLFVYDSGGHTNLVFLTPNLYANIGTRYSATLFSSNLLVIAGGSGVGGPSGVYEYQLSDSLPLPTNAVLVTNFNCGDSRAGGGTSVIPLSNGGVAITLAEQYATGAVAVAYIRPDHTWTNYGIVGICCGNGIFSTSGTSAEMPNGGSLWHFQNKDGSGWISASIFQITPTDLILTNSFQVVNDNTTNGVLVYGYAAPYGEFITAITAISDVTSNRILVTYTSDKDYLGAAITRINHQAILGVTADTNRYLVGISSNYVYRLNIPVSLNQISTNIILGYPSFTTNSVVTAFPRDFDFQTYSDGQLATAPLKAWTNYSADVLAFKPHGRDYVMQTVTNQYHLLLLDGQLFFVDPVTGNDSNTGTQASPWKHLPGALNGSVTNILVGGATVVVKGGTTNFSRVEVGTNYSGAAVYDSILIQSGDLYSPSWGSGRAIIDGGGTNTAGFALGGGLTSGVLNGITIDGFEVRNIAAGAAGAGYDNTSGSSCILAGGSAHAANWLTIKRCYLHDAARSIDNTGHGIEFSGAGTNFIVTENVIGPNIGTKGIEPYRETFGVISNNYISGTGDHCISINGTTNVDICFNVINNNPPYVHEPQYGISVADGRNIDAYDNLIYRSVFPVTNTVAGRSGMGIGIYGISISNRFALNTVAFFNDPANSGAAQSAISQKAGATNSWTEYYNNLVISNNNAGGAIGFTADTASSLSNRMAYCDIFANNGTEQVMATETANVDTGFTVAAYNPTFGIFTNNQQLSPSFFAGSLPSGLDSNYRPNAGYFVLTHSTPVQIWKTSNTNTGDAVHGYNHSANKFAYDINGIPRTVWSMGAYELDQGNVVPFTNVSTFIGGRVFIGGKVFIK